MSTAPGPTEQTSRDQAFVDLASEPSVKPRVSPRLTAIKRLAGVGWESEALDERQSLSAEFGTGGGNR